MQEGAGERGESSGKRGNRWSLRAKLSTFREGWRGKGGGREKDGEGEREGRVGGKKRTWKGRENIWEWK